MALGESRAFLSLGLDRAFLLGATAYGMAADSAPRLQVVGPEGQLLLDQALEDGRELLVRNDRSAVEVVYGGRRRVSAGIGAQLKIGYCDTATVDREFRLRVGELYAFDPPA